MREIIDLTGTEYLSHTYQCAQAYEQYLNDTGATAIITRAPQLTGKETPEELNQKKAEQVTQNSKDMMKLLFTEKAEATEKLLPFFVVLDEGETLPSTRVLAAAMARALSNRYFVDFLYSLM